MRFDNKDLGLFSNEAPKKKKRRIKITEDQYNRLFNINEEDEASTDTSSSFSGGGGPKWETGLTRGKANPIDPKSVWNSGASSYKNLNRGPANPL